MKTQDFFDFNRLSRDEITNLLNLHNLRLTVDEALSIQNTFLLRPPTYAECVLWSIQGSEHCSYKSTRKYLQQFNSSAPQVILGPKEDAGIVSVAIDNQGRRYGIVVSHESHNHPSQLVPYEGAATGVGGNVRDVCCMGAEVIAVADGLRFGDLRQTRARWVHEGVVNGIAGYANPLGIPNISGDVYYDRGYEDNCLVTVVTLGIIREDQIIHSHAPKNAEDYCFILVGKPTDNSGFGGAAFASGTLLADEENKNKEAVQEPNAFLQRHLLKANYSLFSYLRAHNLIERVGFKDLGAGGIACASMELAEGGGYGAEIDLDTVPVSKANLLPAVVLCSETQERFMWVVPRALTDHILNHYNNSFALPDICDKAQATVIGRLLANNQFIVKSQGDILVNAKINDITRGIVYDRPYQRPPTQHFEPEFSSPTELNNLFLQLAAHENLASQHPVFDSYDKQVQGRTYLERGLADAGVLLPFNDDSYPPEIRATAVALALAQNPNFCRINAYWGAANAVFEAVRKVVAVGAWPQAITDCLCFGNPEKAGQMAEFVDAVQGIIDAAAAIKNREYSGYTLPVIAGNVSLYNESGKAAIPPSPMISCIASMPDVSICITPDFKKTHSIIALIGERQDECGGSIYYSLLKKESSRLPRPDFRNTYRELNAVYTAIEQQLFLSVKTITLGGLAFALARSTFKNQIGVQVNLGDKLPFDKQLFSETPGYIVEIAPDKFTATQRLFKEADVDLHVLGETIELPHIVIDPVINVPIDTIYSAWRNGLQDKLLS